MTNEQHNRYIGYAFLANAGFYLLIMAFVAVMFLIIGTLPPGNDPGPPPFFLAIMFGFMALIYGMFALPSVIAGYGVLKHKSWARTASIVAGTAGQRQRADRRGGAGPPAPPPPELEQLLGRVTHIRHKAEH